MSLPNDFVLEKGKASKRYSRGNISLDNMKVEATKSSAKSNETVSCCRYGKEEKGSSVKAKTSVDNNREYMNHGQALTVELIEI